METPKPDCQTYLVTAQVMISTVPLKSDHRSSFYFLLSFFSDHWINNGTWVLHIRSDNNKYNLKPCDGQSLILRFYTVESQQLESTVGTEETNAYLVKTGNCEPMMYMRAINREAVDIMRTDARGTIERFQQAAIGSLVAVVLLPLNEPLTAFISWSPHNCEYIIKFKWMSTRFELVLINFDK